jgi:hypothetical protein
MRKVAGVLVLVGALALPAPAAAVPYLGFGEAARQIGRFLHRNYNVVPGTLETTCERHRRNKVACDFSVWFEDGDLGCGYAQVVETRKWYYTRIPYLEVCD